MTEVERKALAAELLKSIHAPHYGPGESHVEIHGGKVVGMSLVEGLEVVSESMDVDDGEGVRVRIRVPQGIKIEKPVHLCFGMVGERGLQKIELDVELEDRASVMFQAHCTFPRALDISHLMDARIVVGEGARYRYVEKHIHGPSGGVTVVPKTRVKVKKGGQFYNEFYLIEGSAGIVEIDYEVESEAESSVDMRAFLYGKSNDRVKIREAARLNGENAVTALITHIALKDTAQADVLNELYALAPGARGHVDCKEIVQGKAVARAVPVVQVEHPAAHVTHEAAIGSVDSKQLQTLMARGLTEEEATDLIIRGLFSDKDWEVPL